ncbi:hypothetical protein SLEP1_g58739, partial [Rubroshorea leprosula]
IHGYQAAFEPFQESFASCFAGLKQCDHRIVVYVFLLDFLVNTDTRQEGR